MQIIKYVLSCSTICQHVLVPLPKTTASTLLPSNYLLSMHKSQVTSAMVNIFT